jgi:hypothetical protein
VVSHGRRNSGDKKWRSWRHEVFLENGQWLGVSYMIGSKVGVYTDSSGNFKIPLGKKSKRYIMKIWLRIMLYKNIYQIWEYGLHEKTMRTTKLTSRCCNIWRRDNSFGYGLCIWDDHGVMIHAPLSWFGMADCLEKPGTVVAWTILIRLF